MLSRRTFITTMLGALGSAPRFLHAANRIPLASARSYGGFHFGWIPDVPALKPTPFATPFALDFTLPPTVDLRPKMPDVYDQGKVGSCTSNAIAAALQYVRRKSGQTPDFPPSRLFIYYNGRVTENTVPVDSGLSIADGIGAVEDFGACPENEWPYDPTEAGADGKFPAGDRATAKPQTPVYQSAYLHRAVDAYSITSTGDVRIRDLESCLADGYPFVFGFTIYKTFFDNSRPPRPLTDIPLPSTVDIPVGAHAVVAVGYDDSKGVFICRNSWGLKDEYGRPVQDKGHFRMPFGYLKNDDLAADFWTLRAVAAIR